MHLAVGAVKRITECDVAVAIPASTIKLSNIQRICDPCLRFLPLWCRPRKHKAKVDLSQENQRVRIEARIPIGGLKVLLVDDIASTGSTMSKYQEILQGHGVFNIERLAIAHKQGTKQFVSLLSIQGLSERE